MKVLVACECSQTVCNEFRKLGVTAFSCDLEKEYGEHPEWHIQTDVLSILRGDCKFVTNDGKRHYIDKWDLVIAHPPCTFLSRAQNGLYNEKRFSREYVEKRKQNREKAVSFFMQFVNLDCPYLIENPIGYMNTHYRKADQCIEPYMFGDPATKKPVCGFTNFQNCSPHASLINQAFMFSLIQIQWGCGTMKPQNYNTKREQGCAQRRFPVLQKLLHINTQII